jgi:hypothetical protein
MLSSNPNTNNNNNNRGGGFNNSVQAAPDQKEAGKKKKNHLEVWQENPALDSGSHFLLGFFELLFPNSHF